MMKLTVVALLATLMQGIQSQSGVALLCPELEDIEHGSVGMTQSPTIYFVRYTCDVGYEMRGQSRRDCNLLTGEWEGTAPTCEESSVDCGHPGNVTNGTVDVSEGTKIHATAQYTCDEGFIHNGSRSRTCGSDGRWSGTTPTCEVQKICPQPEVEHGSAKVTGYRYHGWWYYAYYTCNVGYRIVGRSYRHCDLLTGELVGTAPTCEESNVDCGHPGNIQYGTVNVSEGTKINARIYYTCDRGYRLNGWSYRTCSSHGAWSRGEPSCVVDCGHPGNITNGAVRVYESTYSKWISYSCDVGYTLNGSLWRRCQSNGTWSANKPTCEANVDCGHPGNIQYGTVNVSEGTKLNARIHYTCDRGYRLNGPSYRTCSSSGRWSGREPTCAIDCGHPGEITNGRVDVSRGTKLGARVRYSCNRGYKLKGPSTRKCKQTGRWDKSAPTCKKRNISRMHSA